MFGLCAFCLGTNKRLSIENRFLSKEEFRKCLVKANGLEKYMMQRLILYHTHQNYDVSDFPYSSPKLHVQSSYYSHLGKTFFHKEDEILEVDGCPTSLINDATDITRLLEFCYIPLPLFVIIKTPEQLNGIVSKIKVKRVTVGKEEIVYIDIKEWSKKSTVKYNFDELWGISYDIAVGSNFEMFACDK